jgi:hypothetical protein
MNKPQSFVQFCKENNFVEMQKTIKDGYITLIKADGSGERFPTGFFLEPGVREMSKEYMANLLPIKVYGVTMLKSRVPLN